MRKLVIIFALAAILCGGCKAKLITIIIPGTTAQIMMRLIPAGTFNMGSPDWEVDRDSDEGPRHPVTLTEPFYMGVYEVTQEQWSAIMGDSPSYFTGLGNPVENISWYDCQAFITALNTLGIGTFRLPTEAEWEYACRAGSTTRFSFGDDFRYSEIWDYSWFRSNSSFSTHTVGQKKPNAWGLCDMHGNVNEWCFDWYGTYNSTSQTDPLGPTTGSVRVSRGGDWSSNPQYCRSAKRSFENSSYGNIGLGFRLVKTSP